ncbi:hypothetical protein [Methylobacterium gnaphalii]|uniref:Uncharacterized protein n=1 Tax=Methylobacterium gnaphalii TaxID=1010610 RepID=A0A512JQB9_9HYPH|nr:hypothetical protein [Methylobacterium gnaphalii]GEP12142.1 hypothetical protein MGN01_39870 [Methylobacterium gnaphalii]GJD70006.1 hypothetical protein MMMDOFMJ_2946 [Methylobacterium gnaphalii]GLS48901.1 hypothetical protein GCM10007885_17480 [Methylobacterium gnaphalii]
MAEGEDDVVYEALPLAGEIGDPMSLEVCPIGPFLSDNGTLCLKTDYENNEGWINAYIVSSGEFFWGEQPKSVSRQRASRVRPVIVHLPSPPNPA